MVIVIVCDRARRVVHVSPALNSMLGISPEFLVGKCVSELHVALKLEDGRALFEEMLESASVADSGITASLVAPVGGRHLLRWSCYARGDAGASPEGVLFVGIQCSESLDDLIKCVGWGEADWPARTLRDLEEFAVYTSANAAALAYQGMFRHIDSQILAILCQSAAQILNSVRKSQANLSAQSRDMAGSFGETRSVNGLVAPLRSLITDINNRCAVVVGCGSLLSVPTADSNDLMAARRFDERVCPKINKDFRRILYEVMERSGG